MFTNKVAAPLLYYVLILGASIFFFSQKPNSFVEVGIHTIVYNIWSFVYMAGGVVGGVSVLTRIGQKVPLKASVLFEVAGMSLIMAAHTVYAAALTVAGVELNNHSLMAVGLLFFAGAVHMGLSVYKVIKDTNTREMVQESLDE